LFSLCNDNIVEVSLVDLTVGRWTNDPGFNSRPGCYHYYYYLDGWLSADPGLCDL